MKDKQLGFYVFLILFVALAAVSLYTVVGMNGKIHPDEYWFERITAELPKYSTSSTWMTVDRPDLIPPGYTAANYPVSWGEKVWQHPPLPYYLFYPVEKLGEMGLFDLYNPAHIRIVPLILMLGTVFLLADIIRRKFNWMLAGLSMLPFFFSGLLLGDGLWLNYEGFMWFFFALSLWLAVVKPKSKWIWVTSCAMLLCKEVAVVLLLVIMLESKNWKYVLTCLVLIPWVAWTAIANNDVLWLLKNAGTMVSGVGLPGKTTFAYIVSCFKKYGVFVYFIFVVAGVFVAIKNIKAYLPYFVFFIVTILYGLVWSKGIIAYEVYSILYSGMFMVAIGFNWILNRLEQKEIA